MARVDNLENFLTDVASAIKEKKGDNTPIPASNFDTEISEIPSGKYAPRYISFAGCEEYDLDKEIANLDTSNITRMYQMFSMCRNLTRLDVTKFKTEKVITMQNMFASCKMLTELDVSNFNTSNVVNMGFMFSYCEKIGELDVTKFNTENVTNMNAMFNACKKLTELDVSNFVTTNVTDMASMFYDCCLITVLDLSGFDFSKVTNINNMLGYAEKLIELSFGTNLGKGYTQKSANYSNYKLDLSKCKKLTHDSLMSVINNLYDLNLTYDIANGGTLYRQQLVLGSTNLAKLTADEIAIATNKGWNVS